MSDIGVNLLALRESFLRYMRIRFLANEIHVEAIENSYTQLIKWCEKHSNIILMLMVEKRFENNKEVREKYLLLKQRLVNPFGLHVHIGIPSQINSIPYDAQYEVIRFGKDFLKRCGIEVVDFSAGWFSFNSDTVKVCKELGLVRFHIYKGQPIEQIGGMKIIGIRPFVIHDKDLYDVII